MEEHDYSKGTSSIESGSGEHHKTIRETFKEGTPDDVRDRVKEAVQKGVAAVAGALKGFTEQSQKTDMPGTTKGAIHQAGETTRSTVSSVSDEVTNLKEPLKEAGQKLSSAAKDLRSTAKEQVDKTREAVRGRDTGTMGGPGTMGTAGAFGSTSLGSTSLSREKASDEMTSSYDLGRTKSGQGTEIPDISRTPLAQSDKKLHGKDLSSEYEYDE